MKRLAALLLTLCMVVPAFGRPEEPHANCCLCMCHAKDETKCARMCVRMQHGKKVVEEPAMIACTKQCKRVKVKTVQVDPIADDVIYEAPNYFCNVDVVGDFPIIPCPPIPCSYWFPERCEKLL